MTSHASHWRKPSLIANPWLRYEYDTAAAILLVIIGIVMLAEYTSALIRQKVS